MSALSAASLSASVGGSGIPAIDQATEPESVRRGGAAARQAYETGLGFESMLVSELAQQLTSTISGSGSGGDGLGGPSADGSDGSDGSSDPAAGAYSSLLPSALAQGVMSGGDTGVAMQIAQSIDPRLGRSA